MADVLFFYVPPSSFKLAKHHIAPRQKGHASQPLGSGSQEPLAGMPLNNQAVGASGAGEGAGPDMPGSVTISVLRTSTRRRG